jgi:hypothetical protein
MSRHFLWYNPAKFGGGLRALCSYGAHGGIRPGLSAYDTAYVRTFCISSVAAQRGASHSQVNYTGYFFDPDREVTSWINSGIKPRRSVVLVHNTTVLVVI